MLRILLIILLFPVLIGLGQILFLLIGVGIMRLLS